MRRHVAFALASMLVVLGSCARQIRVEVDDGLEPLWSALLGSHPLPRGYRVDPRAQSVLRLTRIGWSKALPEGGQVVRVRTLAAVVPLTSAVDDVALEGLGAEGAPAVVPLDEVRPPLRVVSVDGRYPGDDGYPLYENVVLSVDRPDRAMERWRTALSSPPHVDPLCWVAAVGDIMADRGVDRLLLSPERGAAAVFRDTLPILAGADLLLGNFESSSTLLATRAKKAYTFSTDPRALQVLAEAGFDYLSLANNHTFDAGPEGFVDTLRNLRGSGIGTSGAGLTLPEAWTPYGAACGPARIRVWALAFYPTEGSGFDGKATQAAEGRPGVLWADDETVAALVQVLSSGDAIDIVMVHAGDEWSTVPNKRQRALYQALASGGAELVLGSHPHVLQGIEAHAGSLILHSLGNFVFPGMEGTPGGTESVIALLGLTDKAVVAVRLVPVTLEGRTVVLDPDDTVRKRMRALSVRLAQTP